MNHNANDVGEELTMKRFSWAMLALALVFGLVFVSCDNDTTSSGNTPGGNTPGGNTPGGGSIDPALNGTWINNELSSFNWIFNNGICEMFNLFRGTYTTEPVGNDYSTGHFIMKFMFTRTDMYFSPAMANTWNTTTVGWVSRSQFIEIVQHYNDVGVNDIGIDYALDAYGFNTVQTFNYYFDNLGGSVILFINYNGSWMSHTRQ